MTMTPARWTIALAATTILALPMTGAAQTAPPSQPPAAAQPATPTAAQPPEQPPAQQPPAPQQSERSDVAKAHLTAARNALSQITQLPAAAQLQGEARMQVSQLINNFNELITTKSDWKASYEKVESNLNTLLAPTSPEPARPAGTPGAVGTTGTIELDPAIRAKLVEFRSHLDKFEEVASGSASREAEPSATPTTPPTTPPTSTTPPMTTPPPAATTTPPAATTPPPTTPPTTPPESRPDPEPEMAPDPQELLAHVEAIEAILGANAAAQAAAQAAAGGAVPANPAPTGATKTPSDMTLTQAQVQELRTHLAELRRLLEKK